MLDGTWEDFVSLNSGGDVVTRHLGPARDHVELDDGTADWDRERLPLDQALTNDPAPLPMLDDREGYYGDNHFAYWASGLRDMQILQSWALDNALDLRTYLDFGCASGRVLRAFAAQTDVQAFGCDINRAHVDWVAQHLGPSAAVFQNTSLPSLQLPDASVDLVTAYSVFTHVEAFDTAWVAELRRVLRPGGVAWLTFHGERTWRQLQPDWPLYPALDGHPDYQQHRGSSTLPGPRTVYRWSSERSYSANVFYSYDYIRRTWGRLLELVDVFPADPPFQEVVVLRRKR